ncbi:MAG: polysaccharide biosynthesis protein [Actinomycetota bacterium]|nr:polysaccharide biosynthesis protein [Actinomycetota bacterium]
MRSAIRDRRAIIDDIRSVVPPGTGPAELKSAMRCRLAALRDELVSFFTMPVLLEHPFTETSQRRCGVDDVLVAGRLRNRRIAVTGGAGFIGGALIRRLARYQPAAVLSPDNAPCVRAGERIDVRSPASVTAALEAFRPDVVFHLAAERIPGAAEDAPVRAIETNVFGTDTVMRAARAAGTSDFVFCSTGKASRLLTADVYAGTKKLTEWMVHSGEADRRPTRTSIVRFTHVVENSPVLGEFTRKVETGVLDMHDPDRFFYTQNVTEAVDLLLFAVTRTRPVHPPVVGVRDLGWPADALQLALHVIVTRHPDAILYFRGLPPGYQEQFFYGQPAWRRGDKASSLTNAIEMPEDAGDRRFVQAGLPVLPHELVENELQLLRAMLPGRRYDPAGVRDVLAAANIALAAASFRCTPAPVLLDILRWGADPVAQDASCLRAHEIVLRLILAALQGRLTREQWELSDCLDTPLSAVLEHITRGLGEEFVSCLVDRDHAEM